MSKNNDIIKLLLPVEEIIQTEADKDFKYSRENLMNTIEISTRAMEELAQLADQSQQARAYEVLSDLIKTVVQANKDLLDLHKTKNALNVVNNKVNNEQNIQNNLFVGTTAELLSIVEKLNIKQ